MEAIEKTSLCQECAKRDVLSIFVKVAYAQVPDLSQEKMVRAEGIEPPTPSV